MKKYHLGKLRAGTVRSALDYWRREGMLSDEQYDALNDSIETEFDWTRLAFHVTWISAVCLLTGIVALLGSDIFMSLMDKTPAAVRAAGAFATSFFLLYFGFRLRHRDHPHIKNYGILLFIGCAFLFFGFTQVAVALDLDDQELHWLLLPACLIYGLVGWCGKSSLAWLFALFSFSSWLGVRSGYSWGGYWLMDSQPLQSVVYGTVLTVISLIPVSADTLKSREIHGATQVWGLLSVFIPLWILSIWGTGEQTSSTGELIAWSVVMAAAAAASFLGGIRFENSRLAGFGITFLCIEIYTKYCEYFWDRMEKGLFFLILGVSLVLMVRLIKKYRIENRE